MKTLKGLLTDLKVWQLADKHADDPEGFMLAYRRADHADRVRLVRLLQRQRDLKLALLRKRADALLARPLPSESSRGEKSDGSPAASRLRH